MKRVIALIVFFITMLGIMGFTFPEGRGMGALVGALSGALGSLLAFVLVKDEKTRNTAATILFFGIFFGVKFYILPYYYAETFEYRIKEKYPIYAVIAQYYPKKFNEYVDWVKDGYHKEQSVSLADDAQVSGQLVNYAFMQSIPYASDNSVFDYLVETIQLYKKLYSINPGLILVLEFPGRKGALVTFDDLASKLTDDELIEIMKVKKDVIESGNKNIKQAMVFNKEMAEEDFAVILKGLIDKYGSDSVNNTFIDVSKSFTNSVKSAQIAIGFYEDIEKLGEKKAANLLRYILTIEQENN